MKYLVVILGLLTGCGLPCTNGHDSHENNNNPIIGDLHSNGMYREIEIHYIKDTRTNICYGLTYVDRSASIATVPCTEEVERLLKK